MSKTSAVLAVAASVVVAGMMSTSAAAVDNPLQVNLQVLDGKAGSLFGAIEVTVTNTGRHAVSIPRWQLPVDSSDLPQFQVLRDGVPVAYIGKLVKHAAPRAQDMVVIGPGKSVRSVIELSKSYDLSTAGDYQVMYDVTLQGATLADGRALYNQKQALPLQLNSYPAALRIEDGGQLAALRASLLRQAPPMGAVVNGVNYLNCSTSRTSTAGSAVTAARGYSQNARNYLSAGSTGARYTTWFGSVTSSRYSTARSHFNAIDNALDQTGGKITINCACDPAYASAYAYVYPNRPYEIFVCGAFWSAPNTGTDSRAGTLVHEMSHFDVVANTDDLGYGQANAKNLARTNPDRALRNADNHEYFAENSPYQSVR